MSIFKRFSALALSLVMVLSCGSMAFAAEDNTVSLKDIFEEAKAEYQIAPLSDAEETKEMFYKETELENGNKLVIEGYPTEHIVEGTVVNFGEKTDSYVYRAAELAPPFTKPFSREWGYGQTTIKYYVSRIEYEGKLRDATRIDSFSYNIELNSGYNLDNLSIYYMSLCPLPGYPSQKKTINTTQLKMTNYPTTSLTWVFDSLPSMKTGVLFTPTINNNEVDAIERFLINN